MMNVDSNRTQNLPHWLQPFWYESGNEKDSNNQKMFSSVDRSLNSIREKDDVDSPVWETSCQTLEELKVLFEKSSGLVFRGQASASWELNSSLVRLMKDCGVSVDKGAQIQVASKHLGPFIFGEHVLRKLIHRSQENPGPEQELVFAQHHGYPTHLLDWTESLDNALFFAFEDVPVDESGHVAVFAVDVGKIYIHAYCRDQETDPSDVKLDEILKWLKEDGQIFSMSHWTFCRPGGFWDVRMSVQKTVLSAQIHVDSLEDHLNSKFQLAALPGTLVKVSMPALIRTEVMNYLNDEDINRNALFPDLDAMCKKAKSKLVNCLLK